MATDTVQDAPPGRLVPFGVLDGGRSGGRGAARLLHALLAHVDDDAVPVNAPPSAGRGRRRIFDEGLWARILRAPALTDSVARSRCQAQAKERGPPCAAIEGGVTDRTPPSTGLAGS